MLSMYQRFSAFERFFLRAVNTPWFSFEPKAGIPVQGIIISSAMQSDTFWENTVSKS